MFFKFISEKLYFRIILSILVLVSFLWLSNALLLEGYPDFTTYYYGAKYILLHENPYKISSQYFTPLVYPPFTLVFFIPFTIFDYETAAKIWIILSTISVVFVLYILARLYKVMFWSSLFLFICTLTFLFFPLKFTLGMGQINVAILLFTTIFYFFYNKNRDVLAGFFIAIPIMLKFNPILLILYLIYIKKWKLVISCLITIIFFFLCTFLITSLPIVSYYYQHILPDLITSWKWDYYNQSLSGVIARSFADDSLRNLLKFLFTTIFIIITMFVIYIKKKKTKSRVQMEIANILTLSILINNFSWQHHYVFLLLPFIIVYYTLLKYHGNSYAYFILTLSYVLVTINIKNPATVHALLLNHVFIGGFLLWLLSLYLLIKNKF